MTLLTQPAIRFGARVMDMRTGNRYLIVGWADAKRTIAVCATPLGELVLPASVLSLLKLPRDWKARKRG